MENKIILGSGPSGLSYQLFDKNKNILLEKNSYAGGHASSFFIDGFTFDYGPHILFSRDKEILKFIVDSLGDNVVECKRNNKVSYKNKLVKYPFENDLSSLDPQDNYECISKFLFNPYKKIENPKNMKEWFLHTFGEGISDKYLIPYNEKVWNIDVEDLSMSWADRIPNPPADDILKSSIGISTEGYTHQLYYHYPKKGGYQAISEAWAKACDVRYGEEVLRIDRLDDGFKIKTNNSTYDTKKIVSTINLSTLLHVSREWVPKEIFEAYDKLIINPMYVISLGVKGIDQNKYTAIYFGDKNFLVNRISYPATFSELNAPENHYSIQCEITYNKNSDIKYWSDEQLLNHAIEGLNERGLINGEIILKDVKRCSESYVVYNNGYEYFANLIREYFKSINIDLIGRFSYFEYVNIDMAVDRALKSHLDEATKPELIESALAKIRNSI